MSAFTEFATWTNIDLTGYQPRVPDAIDIEVASEATCEHCGKTGGWCLGFEANGSYRAFFECRSCGHVMEF